MKKPYIRPSAYIRVLNTGTRILETSYLLQRGGEKTGSWESEINQRGIEDDTSW